MSNKKVDIITLHRTVNYGSVLQAYATQYVLKKWDMMLSLLIIIQKDYI